MTRHAGIFLVFILCALALYFVPLQSPSFYYDDIRSIEHDDVIKTIKIPDIFNAFNTRFLVGLSFALNYKLSALHPAGYRLINLLIHCFNAFLVYLLITFTLRSLKKNNWEWPAFFGSMLFLCHPIQTEPVNFITQRFVLMGSFFYLLTLVLYVQYRHRSQKKYLITSIISAVAAVFCKEFVVTLPIIITLYEFYFLGSLQEPLWTRCRRLIPFFVVILIVPLLLSRTPSQASIVANIADSNMVQDSRGQHAVIDITRAHGGVSRQRYFLTEVNVVCTYVRLLFVPIDQNLDYDYPLFSRMDFKTVMCGLFLLSLLLLAWLTYRTSRIISFGIWWFFIALSVESSLIPIGHVIAEYRVYLASVGFVLLVMSLVYSFSKDTRRSNFIAVVILAGFSMVTFHRNGIWKDEITLWNDVILKSPYKERPYNNLGLSYDHQGDYTKALQEYKIAMQLNPHDPDPHYNSGVIYGKLNDLPEALAEYNKAIQLNPDNASAYSNRATIYSLAGNLNQAVLDYTQAIKSDPTMAVLFLNRGNVYNGLGRLKEALADYAKAIELSPDYAAAYDDLTVTYYQLKEYGQARESLAKLQSLPGTYDLNRINALKKALSVNE